MRTKIIGGALAGLASAAVTGLPALGAQEGQVAFDGIVLSTCSVVPGVPGTLVPTPGGDALSTEGGTPGAAAVLATGLGYEVAVDAPAAFDAAPPGEGAASSFALRYEASGATLAALVEAGGAGLALGVGATVLTIDAEARRGAGVYPAGAYRMVATVRCVQP